MKTSQTTSRLLAICLLAGLVNSAFAGNAGNVVRTKGNAAVVNSAGQTTPLAAGSSINEGDTVTLDGVGAIQIQMKDGALLALSRESALKVQTYNFEEANGDPDGVKLELQKGRLRTITGAVPQSAYKLSTPSAEVRVLGTIYDALTSNDASTLVLREGEILVTALCNGESSGEPVQINVPGMAVSVSAPCKDPTDPQPVEQNTTDLDQILPVDGGEGTGSDPLGQDTGGDDPVKDTDPGAGGGGSPASP